MRSPAGAPVYCLMIRVVGLLEVNLSNKSSQYAPQEKDARSPGFCEIYRTAFTAGQRSTPLSRNDGPLEGNVTVQMGKCHGSGIIAFALAMLVAGPASTKN